MINFFQLVILAPVFLFKVVKSKTVVNIRKIYYISIMKKDIILGSKLRGSDDLIWGVIFEKDFDGI